jgi:hypothetical protein
VPSSGAPSGLRLAFFVARNEGRGAGIYQGLITRRARRGARGDTSRLNDIVKKFVEWSTVEALMP